MALSASTLKTQLEGISATETESTAISAWGAAFETYFYGAEANAAITVTPGSLAGARSAMEAAMTGLKSDGSKIATGISAFWTAVLAAPAPIWAGTTTPGVAPSGLAGLAATLATTAADNKANNYPKATAAQNFADDIHAACTGPTPGTVTLVSPPGPVDIS